MYLGTCSFFPLCSLRVHFIVCCFYCFSLLLPLLFQLLLSNVAILTHLSASRKTRKMRCCLGKRKWPPQTHTINSLFSPFKTVVVVPFNVFFFFCVYCNEQRFLIFIFEEDAFFFFVFTRLFSRLSAFSIFQINILVFFSRCCDCSH
jgi:hypothetical protein